MSKRNDSFISIPRAEPVKTGEKMDKIDRNYELEPKIHSYPVRQKPKKSINCTTKIWPNLTMD